MAVFYGRAGRLTAKNDGSRPGQALLMYNNWVKASGAEGLNSGLDILWALEERLKSMVVMGNSKEIATQVRKAPSWPRSWATFSLL
jgi:hypothetical protein